jgi:thymidine kinase
VVEHLSVGDRIDYIICDEAQFYQPEQIDGLAKIVDGLGIDVYAFGILADFRTKLFPGSARLVELADRVNTLQVEALCWCGSRATHNARTINGVMVTEGEQVVVGDVGKSEEVAYEVLCRRHHMRKVTARASRSGHMSLDPLPFNEK